MRLPVGVVLLGLAAFGVLLVLTWWGAYVLGQGSEERKWRERIDPGAAPVDEGPASDPLGGGAIASRPRAGQGATAPGSVPGEAPRREITSGDGVRRAGAPSLGGAPAGAEFQAAHNYLVVSTLLPTVQEAEAAAAYLTENGVAAVALPRSRFDRSAANAKNGGGWIVVAVDGIPSEQFSKSRKKADDLKAAAHRIGVRWRKEQRGADDFEGAYWARYKP